MSSTKKQKVVHKGLPGTKTLPNGKGLRIAVLKTRWNEKIVDALADGAVSMIRECGATVVEHSVPGAFELPFAAKLCATTLGVDAVVCVGTLIKGDTHHYEYICENVSRGLMDLQLDLGVPMIFGVLTVVDEQHALDRAGLGSKDKHNHGPEWGQTAVEMALMRRDLRRTE